MWDAVDRDADPEGHLLELATGLDISGRNPSAWPEELRPRWSGATRGSTSAQEFTACFEDQARRKPKCAAAAVASGIGNRMASNPLE